ncbi:MAG: malonyl-ACP O-methyltransferase BioC [Legionellaceae bacterium]|nr:malonyl-ACP O-methyltransferase BioC [Legionellaceae bacterium]
MTLKHEIGKAFDKAAPYYDHSAKVQREIGARLLARLDFIKLNPRYILDLGCGSGLWSSQLRKRYPNATVVSLDLSLNMLRQVQKKQGWLRKWPLLCADMHQLPFADGSFDLVFSNQVVHWSPDSRLLFREVARVMNRHACFMFSTLGPDTFKEIRTIYAGLDNYAHTNDFADMHDIGDQLLGENILDPVVDMEWLRLRYRSVNDMLYALKAQGVKNIHSDRNRGLSGKNRLQWFKEHYHHTYFDGEKYPLSYEVIYGHGWRGLPRQSAHGSETLIPISAIKKSTR